MATSFTPTEDGRSGASAPSGHDPFGAQPATPSSCKHRTPNAAEAVIEALDRAWEIVFAIEEPWLEDARETSLYDKAEERRCMEIAGQLSRAGNGISRYRNGIKVALIVEQIAAAASAPSRGES